MVKLCNVYDENDQELEFSFSEEELVRLKSLTEDEQEDHFRELAYKFSEVWESCREWGEVFSDVQLSIYKEYQRASKNGI